MALQYTTIDRILDKVDRDYDLEDIHEDHIIEWTGEALEALNTHRLCEEAVSFKEVKNYTCEIPKYTHYVIQLARDNDWVKGDTNDGICPTKIRKIQQEQQSEEWEDAPQEFGVLLDCNGQPIHEHEIAYFRPFFDLQWDYPQWQRSNVYSRFTPIRLTNNTFFADIICKEKEGLFGDINNRDEYNIIDDGTTIKFNFESGRVAIAYLRHRLDKNGYPLIPDNEMYTTAIAAYIIMKVATRDFYKHKEGSERVMQFAKQDWQWYCRRARNSSMMPHTIDELQNILENRNYLIPRNNRYHNFFGRLNTPEYRGFLTDRVKNT